MSVLTKKIEKLFLKRKFSVREIAEKCCCSHNAIYMWARRNGHEIEARSKLAEVEDFYKKYGEEKTREKFGFVGPKKGYLKTYLAQAERLKKIRASKI